MEKLIELLNEAHRSGAELFGYCIGNFEWKYYAKNNWLLTIETLGYTDEDYEFHHFSNRDMCGKDGGFIKWLVDNDKIDTNKLKKIGYEKTIYGYDGQYREIEEYSDYEALLMLLAIQDEPIKFLCDMLKDE